MEGQPIKVPGFVVSSIVCLLVSIGATVIVMLFLGYKRGETVYDITKEAKAQQGGAGSAGMMPQEFRQEDAGKAAISKGMNDPQPSKQVVTLIAKLDELTADAGKLELTAEQSAQVREHLAPLAQPEYLADSVAKEHMTEMLKALENHRQALEAAGFKWPAANYNPNIRPGMNPFKEGEPAKHLKSLQERLGKVKQ